MPPLVSIIVPAYNQSHYLEAAVQSALAQTHADVEVIVVDDGSTDDTRAVAQRLTDSRVRYVYQENRGLPAARNTGIRHARGSLLSFLDSDDLFLPDKIRLLLAAMEKDPSLGLVAGQAVVIDERGRPVGEVFDAELPADGTELLLGNPLHVGSVLLRRDWQERVGLFDETLRSYEDWDLWLRLARAGCPMGWVPRPVSQYRFHLAQMTRIGRQMTTATFAVLEKTFSDPSLPQAWRARKDAAYSRAYLRAAAQAYTASAFDLAEDCMRRAVAHDPSLIAADAQPIADIVAGWANHVKTAEPMALLERIYAHLPSELGVLRRRRRRDLAREALQLAFGAHQAGDRAGARMYVRKAVAYEPWSLMNRGVLSIVVRSSLPRSGASGGESPVSARWARNEGHVHSEGQP